MMFAGFQYDVILIQCLFVSHQVTQTHSNHCCSLKGFERFQVAVLKMSSFSVPHNPQLNDCDYKGNAVFISDYVGDCIYIAADLFSCLCLLQQSKSNHKSHKSVAVAGDLLLYLLLWKSFFPLQIKNFFRGLQMKAVIWITWTLQYHPITVKMYDSESHSLTCQFILNKQLCSFPSVP